MTKNFAKVYSAQVQALDAHIITVEVDLSKGLHSFNIVGLTDKAVDEARDRVSAAIKNSGYKPPKQHNKKVVISLAPANLHKVGPQFDLPIALSFLLAAGEIQFSPDGKLFLGELSLDGKLRPITGTLALTQKAKDAGYKEVYVPKYNAEEAALVDGIDVYGIDNLKELIDHLNTVQSLVEPPKIQKQAHTKFKNNTSVQSGITFEDIVDQQTAKRGLIIAAAGGHNIALYGPPGTGKTMLAKAFANILPPLSYEDSLEVTSIHSIAGELQNNKNTSIIITRPQIRSPHHTSSYVSIVGGGTVPKPGEVTLAHKGVLFMDEFPEFDKRVINALRQPLEDGVVTISRAKGSAVFPSQFILIAALNPCPCGYYGTQKCTCTANSVQRYQQKISGPIMDRIDMWIEVGQVAHEKLGQQNVDTSYSQTKKSKKEIMNARNTQAERYKTSKTVRLNSQMSNKHISKYANLTDEAKQILNLSAKKQDLSPRAYHRVIKLARTIADLEQSRSIMDSHILEALSYRPKKDF